MTPRINRETDHFHFVKTLIVAIFLFSMLVLPNMTVCAEGDTVTLSGSGKLTRQYVEENLGDATEVIISGFSEIGENAFYVRSNLTSVTMQDSVTTIGEYAFLGCSNLKNVSFSNNLATIEDSAFCGCSSLTSVTLPNSVITIGESAFEDCASIENVTFSDHVTRIGDSAFSGCSSLTKVTVPDSVAEIGDSAFGECSSLSSISVPNSVTKMGWGVFWKCENLKTAGPSGGGYDIEFGWKDIIPSHAFDACTSLASITIPNSVTTIGDAAFAGCSGLTSITIPDRVTSIGKSALSRCSSLTSVTIPQNVTSMGDYVFAGCSSLVNVTIPSSVTSMGDYAFYVCSSLTNVTIPNNVKSVGDFAFWGCSSLVNVTIPNSVTAIGREAFYGCSGLINVTLLDGMKTIDRRGFAGCTNLQKIVIPSSVREMKEEIFAGCTNLSISGYTGSKAETYANENGIPFVCMEKENDSTEEEKENGFAEVDGAFYWYEGGVKQGTYDDPKGVVGDGTVRGREIYDPVSDGWYWLDACYDGAKACNKEVWMPYIYQNEASWDDAEIEMNANNSGSMKQQVIDFIKNREGKWVRYDANGKMVKGWYTVEGADAELYPKQVGNTYYYDYQTGLMAKGKQVIDGQEYFFDEVTGALQK